MQLLIHSSALELVPSLPSLVEEAGLMVVAEPHALGKEPTVAILGAGSAVVELADLHQRSADVWPVIAGPVDLPLNEENLEIIAAPALRVSASAADVSKAVAFGGRKDGWLHSELIEQDPLARRVAGDALCEWVKARPGVVGCVHLGCLGSASCTRVLGPLINHAYRQLDVLPRDELSVEDMWNVVLLVAVPVSEAECREINELHAELVAVSRDVRGARKVLLWWGETPTEKFGPLGSTIGVGRQTSADPLRAVLDETARDRVEREALELVFKARLTQEDVGRLVESLSREDDQVSDY